MTDASELCHSNVIRRTIYWEMECYEVPWAVKRPLWVRLPECSWRGRNRRGARAHFSTCCDLKLKNRVNLPRPIGFIPRLPTLQGRLQHHKRYRPCGHHNVNRAKTMIMTMEYFGSDLLSTISNTSSIRLKPGFESGIPDIVRRYVRVSRNLKAQKPRTR